jgi:hypothetical protein
MTEELQPPTIEDMTEALWGGTEGLENISEKVTGNWRHGTTHEMIALRAEDSTYWRFSYSTTPNDGICHERGDMKVTRVYPHEVTAVTYTVTP